MQQKYVSPRFEEKRLEAVFNLLGSSEALGIRTTKKRTFFTACPEILGIIHHHSTSAISAVFLDGKTTVFHPWNLGGSHPEVGGIPVSLDFMADAGQLESLCFEDHPTNRN